MFASHNALSSDFVYPPRTKSFKKSFAVIALSVFLTAAIAGAFYLSNPINGNQSQTTPSPSNTESPQISNAPESSPTLSPSSSQAPSPTSSPNPAEAVMTSEVRDLITSASSSAPSGPYDGQGIKFVRGQVLVWDMATDKESDVELLLPSETLANSTDEKITIFAITNSPDASYASNVDVVTVYWPEKIVASYQTIAIDFSRENASIRIPAEWILGLPRSNALPAFTIMSEVQDVILAANATYNPTLSAPSPILSGKVLIWDFDQNKEATYVESLLPSSDLVAVSSEGEITVFAIVKQTYDVVGHYSPGGGAATQVYWDVLVLHYPEKEIVGRHTVQGLYPPSSIYGYSASGDITRPMADWILSLPNATFTPISTSTPTPTPSSSPSILTMDLGNAVAQGLVQANVTGRDLQEISLVLTSNSQSQLSVTVRPGTIFGAKSTAVQSMVALSTEVFFLAPGASSSRTISVACTNMHLDQPSGQDAFAIRTTPTSQDLVKLVSLNAFQSETFRVKQFAVWTITDNPTRSGYTQLGSSGGYSGPTEAEMQRIQTLFASAGISTQNYQALNPPATPIPVPSSSSTPTLNPSKSSPTFMLISNATTVKIGTGTSVNLTGTLSMPKTATISIQWAINSSGFINQNLQFLTDGVFSENFGYPKNLPQPRFDAVGTWQIRVYFSGDSNTNPATSNIITVIVTA